MKIFNSQLWMLLAVMILGVSCTETRYKEPQPKEKRLRSSFPIKMQGQFVDEDGDTFTIEKYEVINESKMLSEKSKKLKLGDSLKIKKYKNYLFLNTLTENNHWNAFLINYKSKTSIQVYAINPKTKTRELKKITTVEEFRNDKGKLDYILINPTKSEWRKILKAEIPELVYTYRRVY